MQGNKPCDCEQVAKAAGTTMGNFIQVALYGGACSYKLAKKLEAASEGRMTAIEILDQNLAA